jgi:sarcosine oxidase
MGITVSLRPTRETVGYFHIPAGDIPTFVEWGDPTIYALPSSGQGIKVGEHIAGPVADPDEDQPVSKESLERLQAWIASRFPDAEPEQHFSETCFYTNTEDESFVLERRGDIVIGSPCSGHGFKFAPLIGERLADLAMQ